MKKILRAKNWKVVDNISLYTTWNNKISDSTVEVRKNFKLDKDGNWIEINIWDVSYLFIKIGMIVIAENIPNRQKAKEIAVEWMKKHPNGLI